MLAAIIYMVYVDFGNPFLRDYLANHYCAAHRQRLNSVRARLAGWAAESQRSEDRAAGRRPLAAVFDIDEVLLCNIHMNVFHAPAGGQENGPVDFHACDYFLAPDGAPWPRADVRLNPLLPGARELLAEAAGLGIALFLNTGRSESIRAETVENFAFVGLAGDGAPFSLDAIARPDGPLMMCPDAEHPPPGGSIRPFKEGRRALIEKTHRIVINIGDQVSDLGLHGDVQVLCPHPFYYTQ